MDTSQSTFNSTRSTIISSSTISSEALKQKSHWMVFKYTVNEYAYSSSAHGIIYIFESGRLPLERLFWKLVVGFALIFR